MNLAPRPKNTTGTSQSHRLIHRLKVAKVMEMRESDFGRLISDIEKDPLFKRFYSADNPKHRLFGHRRFPHSGMSSSFLELNEGLMVDKASVDLEGFLEDKQEIIRLCQKIGQENFEQYFLYNEGRHSIEDIASTCLITPAEVKKAMDMVNHIAVQEEFVASPMDTHSPNAAWDRIGLLEMEKDDVRVTYSSLRYARGRYHIDYTRLATLKNAGDLKKEEWQELRALVRSMELVNTRKATICMILDAIAQRQKAYLRSQRKELLEPMSQIEMAQVLGLHSSTISRALTRKSVMTPWKEEIPLKAFFVKGLVFRMKATMQDYFFEENEAFMKGVRHEPLQDDEIRDRLRQLYGVPIATRTVAKYRGELAVPNVYLRAREFKKSAKGTRETASRLSNAADRPEIRKDSAIRQSL